MTTTEIITSPSEDRQIAKVLTFDKTLVRHINWDSIAKDARELGAHWEARTHKDDSLTVTMFWSYAEGEER